MTGLAMRPAWAQQAAPTAASDFHRLLLCTDGTVKGWGLNQYGQLGTASAGSLITTPTTIPLANPAVVVRTATNHSCSYAVGADGSLWAWGSNSNGELGVGSGITQTSTATQVTGIANVVAVSGGAAHAAAVCADGTVWTWGAGQNGESGTGTIGIAYTPQQISPSILHDIRQVVCGFECCLALDASGHVWSWGHNGDGQLGTGASAGSIQSTPVQIAGLSNIRHIEADNWSAAAVANDGKVYDWGRNTNGVLGLGNSSYVGTPALVGTWPGATSIALADGCALVTRGDGTTIFWGNNNLGQRGIATAYPTFSSLPVAGPTFTLNVQIFGVSAQFMSIERTGTVKTWGSTGNCPLGYTPTTPGVDGGSCVPTTPTNACLSVPKADFAPCGPQGRAYFQYASANYEAARHGYTVSPAEIGTPGTTTVIDVSQAPYNGTLTFSGVYRLRGPVRFTGGEVRIPFTTIYADAGSSLEFENATLRLNSSTLQANCPSGWVGVRLLAQGKAYIAGSAPPKGNPNGAVHSRITGAYAGVNSTSYDSEYYISYTNFAGNNVGVYDYNYYKNPAHTGEGVKNCLFTNDSRRTTDIGIVFEPGDGNGTSFAGDYSAASFDHNTFTGLQYGISGYASNAPIDYNTFTNNTRAALYTYYSSLSSPMKFRFNTINLLAVVTGQSLTTTYGLDILTGWQLENNTIRCQTPVSGTSPLKQVGARIGQGCQVGAGNIFLNLDQALDIGVVNTATYTITGNTFTDNKESVVFRPQTSGLLPTPIPTVTLRCNSFSSTVTGAVGVCVLANTLFPATLGSASQPNGNNFSGIADVTKRFVYDATTNFQYYRYNSTQEALGGAGNSIYPSTSGTTPNNVALVTNTGISGNGACGTSSATPGVYARPAAGSPTGPSASTGELSPARLAAYPNPARDIVTFAYVLTNAATTGQVLLRDLMGRVVKMATTGQTTGEVQLPVAALPAGFYTATLEVEGRAVATQKLAIQR